MTHILYQGNRLPTQSCLIQYRLNQPPTALLQLEPHVYIRVEPGQFIEVTIQSSYTIINHWLIESSHYDGIQQSIHATHPIQHLSYEWGTQPFYQMSPLKLLQDMLAPLGISLLHEKIYPNLLKKIPLCFKYQTESSLNFLNWLCDFAQMHWACQLDHHQIHLIGGKETVAVSYELTQSGNTHQFFHSGELINSTLSQVIWSQQSSYPSFLLKTPLAPITLGTPVHCQHEALRFLSIVQTVYMEIIWRNSDVGEITQTLCIAPIEAIPRKKTVTPHATLLEAITEGVADPSLNYQGKQSVRFLLDESSAQSTLRKQSPLETITPFSQKESTFQTPIPALQHVLTLCAMHRQNSYLLGGLYQYNQPSPQSIKPDMTNQFLFPKQYGLTITEKDQQTLALRDEKNGLSLTLNYRPNLECLIKNSNCEISFSGSQYHCVANGLSLIQAHQKITWLSEEMRLYAPYCFNQTQSQLNITTNIFYQSAPNQTLSCEVLNAEVQQQQGNQDSFSLKSNGGLQIESNTTTVIEAKQTITLKTPSATISISANEINLSSLAIDFSPSLLTLAGKICFNPSHKPSQIPPCFHTNAPSSVFTNLEKSRYDENATLIDAFVFYQ